MVKCHRNYQRNRPRFGLSVPAMKAKGESRGLARIVFTKIESGIIFDPGPFSGGRREAPGGVLRECKSPQPRAAVAPGFAKGILPPVPPFLRRSTMARSPGVVATNWGCASVPHPRVPHGNPYASGNRTCGALPRGNHAARGSAIPTHPVVIPADFYGRMRESLQRLFGCLGENRLRSMQSLPVGDLLARELCHAFIVSHGESLRKSPFPRSSPGRASWPPADA